MADAIKYRVKEPERPGPLGMYSLNRPDLGLVGEGYIVSVLTARLADWRKANGWPIGLGFEEEIHQALCAKYMADYPKLCITDDPRDPLKPIAITARDILNGTRIMVSFSMEGRPKVSTAEAERRAAICANCPMLQPFVKGCGNVICGKLKELVDTIIQPKPTSQDAALEGKGCFICKCFVQGAIWLPQDLQWAVLSDHQKVQFEQVKHCWKRPQE